MEQLRKKLRLSEFSKEDDIIFQCLDWSGNNELREIEDSKFKSYEYVIKLFGITKEGFSVSVTNYNFQPYLYIKVPRNFDNSTKTHIANAIKKNLDKRQKNGLVSLSFVKKKEFYGFTNNKEFLFIKLVFKNTITMRKTEEIIKNGFIVADKGKQSFHKFKIYESNITPFLRFIHTKDLSAAGWVKIPKGKYTVNEDKSKKTTSQIDISIDYNDIEFIKINRVAPIMVASFDIECSSSHGDFPQAKKTYKKPAHEIYDTYADLLKDKKFLKLKEINKIETISSMIESGFGVGHEYSDDISKIYTIENEKPDTDIIMKAARNVFNVLNTKESYKLLVHDILRYFYKSSLGNIFVKNESFLKHRELLNKYTEYGQRIKKVIETSFYDNGNDKEDSYRIVSTIYTKTNKKPTRTQISSISNRCLLQILMMFKKIFKSLEDYELDTDEIYNFIILYTKHFYKPTKEKITIFQHNYEMDETDIKTIINAINSCENVLYSYFGEFPEIDGSRDTYCKRISSKLDYFFPMIEGDKVIQIGTTVRKYGEKKCFLKHIITLKSCSEIENAVVESYQDEKDVLLAWTNFIQKLDPDIITGYNIFGFDFAFMYNRAEEIQSLQELSGKQKEYDEGCLTKFSRLGRVRELYNDEETGIEKNRIKKSRLEVKKLASSALGDNVLKYITMEGRIVMDLLKIVQKDFNLVSYKLDYVSENFINDKITAIDGKKLTIRGIETLQNNNFVSIQLDSGKKYKDRKFKIVDINYKKNQITLEKEIPYNLIDKSPKWTLAKDDVSPKDIFRLQDGSSDDRKIVAVYCIQDCVLCNNLIDKLKIITNNIGMANVCYVPLSYLFLRGQGIKIFSLVARQCWQDGTLIPVIKYDQDETSIKGTETCNNKFDYGEDENENGEAENNNDGYEGAIVLPPKPNIYLNKSVTVLDYASLYPSSMISENLSHDSIVLDNEEGRKYLGDKGKRELEKIGYGYEDIHYDIYKWKNPKIKGQGKIKCGIKTCRFVQPKDGSKSIIPNILKHLLKSRKDTRKKIKYETVYLNSGRKYSGLLDKGENNTVITDEEGTKETVENNHIMKIEDTYNDFEKSVLDGSQLAFKLTANSLYGQIGAKTSAIHLKDIAASTTATGRKLLYLAKEKVEEHFEGAEIVYGDTDSIFIDFNAKDKEGKTLENREGLKRSIELGVEAEKIIQPFLKAPHKLEYEKTFWPFILFSKKRYIGNKYEFKTGEKDYKQTSMGIVLKRRDNADIVKHIYGGVIDILMNQKNLELSIKFLKQELMKLLNGEFGIDMLVITKSLRGYYKNPQQIAHKVLADRMGVRDPGNKPSSNDRIPYVYIEVKETKHTTVLQGNRIEHIDYIREKNIKPDYKFYITNQIMKPVVQIYALIVEQLKGFKYDNDYYTKQLEIQLKTKIPEKAKKKIDDMRNKEAGDIIFGDVIRVAENRKNRAAPITNFFKLK